MSESKENIRARARALAKAERDLLSELVALRKQHDLTQSAVAQRMGVSQAAVSQVERYDANPTLSTIRRYALAVGARIEHRVIDDQDGYVESRVGNVIPFPAHTVRRHERVEWARVPNQAVRRG